MKPFALSDIPAKHHAAILAQLHPRNSRQAPLLESGLGLGALGEGETKGGNTGRVLVRVTAFRVRLLDEDNLCAKFHVDCCRYSGILSGDDPRQAKIETGQVKVRTKAEERVLIEITPLLS